MELKYLKMIRGIKKRGKKEWSVYVVRCSDDSLYTGIAKSVEARLSRHNSGKGAAYTRTRRPVTLLYSMDNMTRSAALVCEARIKALPKAQKEGLVANGQPPWSQSQAERRPPILSK